MINEDHFKFFIKPNAPLEKQLEVKIKTLAGEYTGKILMFNYLANPMSTKYLENLTIVSNDKNITIDGIHIVSIEVV